MSPPSTDPDTRYARGEISREEWLRLRGPAQGAPPVMPPPPARTGPALLIFVAVLVIVVIGVVAAVLWFRGTTTMSGWNPTGGGSTRMQASDLAALNASATNGAAYSGNNTLWFRGTTINLVMYASPPDHDMMFVVQGMANPTIHMPAGARVTVTMVNMDSGDYHNFAMSGTGPPFNSMPMMGSGSMMSMTMVSPCSSSVWWSGTMSFTTVAGSYWYLCQVSGHAASGMYGSFVVG